MLAKSGINFSEQERTPAAEGGIRGLPSSALRHISATVARGTLASSGRLLGGMPWGDAPRHEQIRGLALAQMWAQARLMGAVMGGNQLIAEYIQTSATARPSALA